MPLCRLLNGVKVDGIRHAPGAVIDMTEEDFVKLPVGTAVRADVPPAMSNGPTLEEYVAAGYLAENYPPEGYAIRESPGLDAYRAAQEPAAAVEAASADTPAPPEESAASVVEDITADVSTG